MVIIHPHAHKHGISDADINYALGDGWFASMIHPKNPYRKITLGFDSSGSLIQVIEADDQDVGWLVINAMRPPQAHVLRYFE